MKTAIKTYIICTSRPGKSIPNYFFGLGEGLVKMGNKVTMVCDLKYNKEQSRGALEIVHWPNDRPTKWNDAIFFKKLCQSLKPDVVVGQFGSKVISMAVSRYLGIKNRIVYHHTLSHQLNHDLGKTNGLKDRIQQLVYAKLATHILANSQATKNDIVSNYDIEPNKIDVVPYLLKDVLGSHILNPISKRKQEILFVSRVDPSKGHAAVIEQIPSVLEKFPQLIFTFIGKGSEVAKLKKRCAELKVDNAVKFLGFVNPAEICDYMQSALMHVSASKAEAFGLVNAEAISLGTPILGPRTGGIADIIDEGQNGYFFNPDKEMDLVQKIELVLQNWNTLSKGARLSFMDRYSLNNADTVNNQINQIEAFLN